MPSIAIKPNLAADRCAGRMGELIDGNPGWNINEVKFLDVNSMSAILVIAEERDFEF